MDEAFVEPASTVVESVVVEEEGDRVDRFASRVFARLPTRGAARKAAKRGELLLNGQEVESSRFVRVGDVVSLRDGEVRHPACALTPELAYVDPRCAVVVKPAGLLVNGNRHRTLEHALPNALPASSEPDALVAPRPVHRLDFETMGLVAVARCHRAMVAWSRDFEERRVRKRYRAIVVGRMEGEGRVEVPLDGREAVSTWRAVRAFHTLKTDWCTVVDLEPVTGRMHQLRRHLHGLGHPILGDRRYCADGLYLKGSGLFLAAVHLDLPDPDGADTRIAVSIEPPAKLASFEAREVRRWARWHGKNGPTEED
ncbi:MAG: RluA family pseudouridine synthase [Myxococcota bacterium]